MEKRFSPILAAVAAAVLAISCNPQTYKNISYVQDIQHDTIMPMSVNKGIVIQPQDQLSIIVSSRTPALAAEFNLPVASYIAGSELTAESGASVQRLIGYVVDNNGNLQFPALGTIHVAGKTRWELQDYIREELIDAGLIKDPIVTVQFMNFKISVLGEVNRGGTFSISGDKISLLQAISLAGDLTIHGRRDRVIVNREQNGKRMAYVVDIRSTDLFSSPAYYLQQNDVVYVEPSSVRAGQSTINENYFKSAGFWMSIASMSMTVTNFIITLTALKNK